MIEQGKVDMLLQSSAQERRAIFEEAAGISKYRARKKEALRKLDRTEQNLLRIEDIVEEVEKRLRSVKLQAGKARSFQAYQQQLNELRSSYALAEYHRFTERLRALEVGQTEQTDAVTARRGDITRLEASEAERASDVDELGEKISAADGELVRARSDAAALDERLTSARARIEEQQTLRERTQQRHAGDRQRLEETQTELDAARRTIEVLDGEARTARAQLEAYAERDRELAREVTQTQAVLDDEKAGVVDLLRRGAQMHNEIIRLNTHHESLVGQQGRLRERGRHHQRRVGGASGATGRP